MARSIGAARRCGNGSAPNPRIHAPVDPARPRLTYPFGVIRRVRAA